MEAFNSLSRRGQLIRLGSLARRALENYALSVTRVAPLKHEHNTTFQVWAAGDRKFVLRIHRPGQHTLEAIHSELLWLEALNRETRLDVPRPVRTEQGKLFNNVEVEGVPEPRVCVLFPWIEGRFIDEGLQPIHLEQVGLFTALLHEHASGWSRPPGFVRGRVDVLTAQARKVLWEPVTITSMDRWTNYPTDEDVERCLQLISSVYPLEAVDAVGGVIQRIRQALNELGQASDKFGLIHADLHQENYFFHRGRVRAIDFDDCGFGHYLFDLNVTLIEIQYLPHYAELRKAFLSGYRKVRSLPEEDEAYLETFFALRHLQLLTWVLESREHPAFRDEWEPWARSLLDKATSIL